MLGTVLSSGISGPSSHSCPSSTAPAEENSTQTTDKRASNYGHSESWKFTGSQKNAVLNARTTGRGQTKSSNCRYTNTRNTLHPNCISDTQSEINRQSNCVERRTSQSTSASIVTLSKTGISLIERLLTVSETCRIQNSTAFRWQIATVEGRIQYKRAAACSAIGQCISAAYFRESYQFLVPGGAHYYRWVRRFKENPMFREGIDWVKVFLSDEENPASSPTGGRPSEDYRLTTWVCEHLGQMQDSPRGHQIREYFSGRYRLAANQLNDNCCKQS